MTETKAIYFGKGAPPTADQGDFWINQDTGSLQIHNGLRFADPIFRLDGTFSSLEDSNSLVAGNMLRPDWDKLFATLAVKALPAAESLDGLIDTVHVNPYADSPAIGGKIIPFATPSGVTSVIIRCAMKLPTGVGSSTPVLRVLDVGGSVVAGTTLSCPLTSSFQVFTETVALSAGTEYSMELLVNNAGQHQAICGPISVEPVGGSGVFADDFERLHVMPDMLWHNGRYEIAGGTGLIASKCYNQSPQAQLVFDTTAISLSLEALADVYNNNPVWAHYVVLVDGKFHSAVLATTRRLSHLALTLPDGRKRVAIITGLSTFSGAVQPCHLRAVYVPAGELFQVIGPPAGKRLVIYGDSIVVGANATYPSWQGWTAHIRRRYLGTTIVEAHGSRSLNDDGASAAARLTLAKKLAAMGPAVVWITMGTNDYGLNLWTAANFGTAYADLLDQIHAAAPGADIYAQTPISRVAPSTEAANGLGSTLGDYRTQITTAVSTRAWATLVDGAAILAAADLDTDGIHPTVNGHAKFAASVATTLGI